MVQLVEAERELRRSASQTRTRIVALLEIGGGIFGLGWLAYLRYPAVFVNLGGDDGLMVALCSLAMYSGWYLWRGYRRGYRLSLITQAIQLVRIAGPMVSYQCCFGLGIEVGWIRPNLIDLKASVLNVQPGFAFRIQVFADNVPFGFAINVVAVWAMIHLLKILRRAAEREAAEARCVAVAAEMANSEKPNTGEAR